MMTGALFTLALSRQRVKRLKTNTSKENVQSVWKKMKDFVLQNVPVN